MKQAFVFKRFSPSHKSILLAANSIIVKYQEEGYDLTLRQLYYQFIALNLFPDEWLVRLDGGQMTKNHERNYKKLGGILNDARLAGLIDWDAIVDRTRQLNTWWHEENVPSALERMKRRYTLDFWKNQEVRVEVWVEKEALAGVFERVCGQYDVPYFACRGYASASSSYAAYQRIKHNIDHDQRTIILHFGDHDPSGLDMTRDNRDRLETMVKSHFYNDEGSDFENAFEIRRMALNHDQVLAFNPPPITGENHRLPRGWLHRRVRRRLLGAGCPQSYRAFRSGGTGNQYPHRRGSLGEDAGADRQGQAAHRQVHQGFTER